MRLTSLRLTLRRTTLHHVRGKILKVLPDGSVVVLGPRTTWRISGFGVHRRVSQRPAHLVEIPPHAVRLARELHRRGAEIDVRVTIDGVRPLRRRQVSATHARNAAPLPYGR